MTFSFKSFSPTLLLARFTQNAALLCDVRFQSRQIFAVCEKYVPDYLKLTVLPQGEYLCRVCGENDFDTAVKQTLCRLQAEQTDTPRHFIAEVKLRGLLKWDYELQFPLSSNEKQLDR